MLLRADPPLGHEALAQGPGVAPCGLLGCEGVDQLGGDSALEELGVALLASLAQIAQGLIVEALALLEREREALVEDSDELDSLRLRGQLDEQDPEPLDVYQLIALGLARDVEVLENDH